MTFLGNPLGGPGEGFFPRKDGERLYRNRSGSTNVLGDTLVLDWRTAATEINATDSNSFLPGRGDASDDSVWNTVTGTTAALNLNGCQYVVMTEATPDNDFGKGVSYGLVEAVVVGATNHGAALIATASNSLIGVAGATNAKIIAHKMSPNQTGTNRVWVFLHQGIFDGAKP